VSHSSDDSSLKATVRFPRLDALPSIIARIRRMFDLGADPSAIASVLSSDPILAPIVAARPGLRVPGGWDGFEVAVRAVLGQQITVRAATRLATRLVAALGDYVDEEFKQNLLTRAFPRPDRFDVNAIAELGMPKARAQCLAGVAKAALADDRLFDPSRDLTSVVDRLRELPGVGEWTAQYIAMRAMGESDAFLATDIGIRRGISRCGMRLTASQLIARAERWRPWRAYAMLHLWMADADAAKAQPSKEVSHAVMA
jgi:AraC family transcriptional regulator of adaptative response / DNA-3-methyladenine glycosylase II